MAKKFVIYSLVIIFGVGVLVAMSKPDGRTASSSKSAAQDPAKVEKLNCIRYVTAMMKRAQQCDAEGFEIKPHWYAMNAEKTPLQLNTCLFNDFTWKQSESGTAACVAAFASVECARFNEATWLDGPPCVN